MIWIRYVVYSVTGLNIEDPESARKIIKTWDERHDMELFCESGVDDQVSAHWSCHPRDA